MLTEKQRDLLLFIHEHMNKSDIAPSYEEMKEALGLKSKSGIHRLISALVERGYIERLPHRARAIEIIRLPEGFRKKMKGEESPEKETELFRYDPGANVVPLYGRIAAGTPIEAIRDEGQTIALPAGYTGAGEHYALKVDGDSMIEAGIHTGDTVIIKRCDTAENGMIVVALIDDEEVTLKRFRRAGNKIILEPENKEHEPRVLDPGRVKIQGRLVSLLRTYH